MEKSSSSEQRALVGPFPLSVAFPDQYLHLFPHPFPHQSHHCPPGPHRLFSLLSFRLLLFPHLPGQRPPLLAVALRETQTPFPRVLVALGIWESLALGLRGVNWHVDARCTPPLVV